MPDNDPGVLARELRGYDFRMCHGPHVRDLMLRAADYLESISAPVEDEVLDVLRDLQWQGGYDSHERPVCPMCRSTEKEGHVEHCRIAVAMREYAVGVTVGEPALTGLEVAEACVKFVEADAADYLARADRLHEAGVKIEMVRRHEQAGAALEATALNMRAKFLQANGVSGSPSSPKQTSELEEAEAIGCGGMK